MKTIHFTFIFTFSILLSLATNAQKFNNLASTPPMGWNNWNKFEWKIDEQTVREIADAMVSSFRTDNWAIVDRK